MRLRREQADEQVCTVAVRMPVALRDRLDRERHRRVVGRNPVIVAAIESWLDEAEHEAPEGHVWVSATQSTRPVELDGMPPPV